MTHPSKYAAQTTLNTRWYPMTNIPVLDTTVVALLPEVDRVELEQQTLQKLFNLCYAQTV